MKKPAIFLALLLFITGLSGCGQRAANQEDAGYYTGREEMPVLSQDSGPAKGGILSLFMTTPDSLNPLYTLNPYVRNLSMFVFDSLFIADGEDSCVNLLAESWQLSDDGVTLDIKLRDKITFHDGSEFSAKDVAFTIEAIRNAGARSPYMDNVANIDSVMVTDRLQVRMIFRKKDPRWQLKMTFPILPEHVFRDWPIDGYDPDQKLIGTGAYRFDAIQDDVISLSRHDDWWYVSAPDGLGHPVWIDRIQFIIHGGEHEMMASFQKNIIDIATVSGNNMDYYANRSDILYSPYVGNRFEYILLSNVGADNRRMENVAFRTILLRYLAGYMTQNPLELGVSAIEEVAWGDMEKRADREEALAALEELGMVYDERKNVLYTFRNGARTPLNLSVRYNSLDLDRETVAEWLQAALNDIGINVVLEKSSEEEEMKAVANGRFDIMVLGSRIPHFSSLEETLELICGNLGLGGEEAVILPLYRKSEAALYSLDIRGAKEPFWKNVYNGWTDWYLVRHGTEQ